MPHTVTQVLGVGSYGDRRQRGKWGREVIKRVSLAGGWEMALGVNATCGVRVCIHPRFNPKKK